LPKAAPIKATFASGEVSPLMYGRVDLQQYYNGLEFAENMLVRPYGLIMNRPGAEFIAPVKFPDKDTKLIEFTFNESDAFIIEFGEFYFRFFTLGASVTEPTKTITGATQTNPVVVSSAAHGYSVGDEIIINSVVGMTELNGRRYRLSAVTAGTYDIEDLDGVDIDGTGFTAYISGGTSDKIYEVAHTYTESELFDVHFAQINDVLNLTHGDHRQAELIRMAADDWVLTDIDFIGGPVQDLNITVTTIDPSSDTGATTLTASTPIFLAGHVGSVWRVNDGFVEITGFTSTTIVTGTVQDTSLGTGPAPTTVWAEASWSDVAGYPATITYHERRRWYARTRAEPQTQWASKPFIYDNFDVAAGADDDALNLTLNTEKANDIKWMSSGTTLATGTFGGEFISSSGTNGISLTPDNANATRQTGWGSRNIQPQKIANFVYYIQRASRKVRELFYYWDLDTYKSVDMTILSEHITKSGIVNIAYQQNPDTSLYCVREDGEIAILVREEDQQVKAWTRAVTDGLYKSVATIPSFLGPYDEVWTVVERVIDGVTRKYIERFADSQVPDRQEDCFYVDSGLQLKVYPSTTGIGLTLSAVTGNGITATASGAIFESNDIGQRIRAIDEDGEFIGELLITGFTSDTVVTGDVTLDFDSTTYTGSNWGVSVTTISGLDHLEGKLLSILGDGAVQTQKPVVSGSVTLERDVFELSIGLPYVSFLKTLSIEAGSETGTAQGKKKRIYQLGLRVFKTLGIKVGGTVDKVFIVTLRDPQVEMGRPIPLVSDTIPNIRFTGGWVYEGTIVILQDNPLPMHILDIMPQLKTADKTGRG
jgi:hypothetical protein